MSDQEQKSSNVLKVVLIVFGLLLLLGCLAAAAAVIVPAALFQRQVGEAQGDLARTQGASVRSGALLYMLQQNAECPTPDELELESYLMQGEGEDPWGTEYRIECVDGDPTVISAGPDGSFGTADDVTVD